MIYHITESALWQRALALGFYVHPSLKEEGFIHCSKENQLGEVGDEHFADAKEVLVLHIVERRIKDKVKYEEVDGEEYPHIYGKIPIDAIEDITIVERGDDGAFKWEDVGA
jgi:uncharacterized protein (DUF952 family)